MTGRDRRHCVATTRTSAHLFTTPSRASMGSERLAVSDGSQNELAIEAGLVEVGGATVPRTAGACHNSQQPQSSLCAKSR